MSRRACGATDSIVHADAVRAQGLWNVNIKRLIWEAEAVRELQGTQLVQAGAAHVFGLVTRAIGLFSSVLCKRRSPEALRGHSFVQSLFCPHTLAIVSVNFRGARRLPPVTASKNYVCI